MRKNSFLVLSAITVLFCGLFLLNSNLTVNKCEITDFNNQVRLVSIPYYYEAPKNVESVFLLTVIKKSYHHDWLRIVPDDRIVSIKVNGNDVPLENIPQNLLSNYEKGFVFPIGKYLPLGTNSVEIKIWNGGGQTGLKIFPVINGIPGYFVFALLMLSLFVLCYFILKSLKLDNRLAVLILAGFAIRLVYLSVTPWYVRSHDVDSHIDYIEFIANHFMLPDRNAGFVFYHPPLYYILSAVIYKILQLFSGINEVVALYGIQILSVLCNLVFTITSIKIIELSLGFIKEKFYRDQKRRLILQSENGLPGKKSRLLKSGNLLLFFGAMLVFWPSNIIHSVRIGNDVLLYPLYALSLLFLMKWDRSKSLKDLYVSVLFSTLSLLTKTNSIILMVITGILYLADMYQKRNLKSELKTMFQNGLKICAVFFLGFLLAFGGNITGVISKKSSNLFVGNTQGLHSGLLVGNAPSNFLYFDSKNFVTEPFTSAWEDHLGRQYFWNYLLKTGLFGEFGFPGLLTRNMAMVVSFSFLLILIYSLAGIFLMRKKDVFIHRVTLLSFAFLVAEEFIFRIMVPYSCSNDFRYILPALVSFIVIYSYSSCSYREKGWKLLFALGTASGILFIICGIVFFISLRFS